MSFSIENLRIRAQIRLNGDNPHKFAEVPHDIPYEAPIAHQYIQLTSAIGAAAEQIAQQDVPHRLRLNTRKYEADRSFSGIMFGMAVSIAMRQNGLIRGKDHSPTGMSGIFQLAEKYVHEKINRELEKYTNEPTGSEMDLAHREVIRDFTVPALQLPENIPLSLVQDLDRAMAKKDAQRARMSDADKYRAAISDFARSVARFTPAEARYANSQLETALAAGEVTGFLVDLWGPESKNGQFFYIQLGNQMKKHLLTDNGGIRDFHDPYRLGIAYALHNDPLHNVFENNATELAFARMWRRLTRAAAVSLMTQRLFKETTVTSPAGKLVDAFKLYLDNKGMRHPKVVDAIAACRQHVYEVTLGVVNDVIDYAHEVEPFYIHPTIHDIATHNGEVPRLTKDGARQAATGMVGRLAADIDSVAKGAARPKNPSTLFAAPSLS